MKATEIIRDILDIIDKLECEQTAPSLPSVEISLPQSEENPYDDGSRRFKQIFDILSGQAHQTYDNSPGVIVAGIDSVTKDAGGGLNGPKHPSDMRADSVSMYPFHQHNPGV